MTARTKEYARLAAQGMTATEIAAACGVCRSAVVQWAQREAVDLPDGRKSAARREDMSRSARAQHADPAINPLAALTTAERAAYDKLKRKSFTRNRALCAIGRADLIREGRA